MAVMVFLTSLLSGIFGMAGGLVLLWMLMFIVPIQTAIMMHGFVQMVSNGSRVWFSRNYLNYHILFVLMSGLVLSAAVLFFVDYRPNLVVVSMVIGVMPIFVWIPLDWLKLDAQRPVQAFLCGFISGALSLGIGVSGPTVDMFFIKTSIDRRTVIATKAAFQFITHSTKVVFYWEAAMTLSAEGWFAVIAAAPIAVLGTRTGNAILHRMSNADFRSWTRWIVTVVGAVYFIRGILHLL